MDGSTRIDSRPAAGNRGDASIPIFQEGDEVPGTEWRYLRPLPRASGQYEIHLLEDPERDRTLLMKTPHGGIRRDPAFVEAFRREALRLASFPRHPNLVSIVDFRLWKDRLCLFMEYIDGTPLASLLGAMNPLSSPPGAPGQDLPLRAGAKTPAILGILLSIARGMAAAYAADQTLHLDLSPWNILVSNLDGGIRIIDFGLPTALAAMEAIDPARPASGGTAGYRAPEMARGLAACDTRSDLYSFGLVGISLWLGRLLGEGDGERFRAVLDALAASGSLGDRADPDATSLAKMPANLSRLLRACLAPDPEDRQAGFSELEGELEDLYYALFAQLPLPAGEEDGPRSLFERATALADLGAPRKALSLLEQALALPAESEAERGQILLAQAAVLSRLGKSLESYAVMDRVPESSRNGSIWVRLEIDRSLYQGEVEEALRAARGLEEADPADSETRLTTLITLLRDYHASTRREMLGAELTRRYTEFRRNSPEDPRGLELGETIALSFPELDIDLKVELERGLAEDWKGICHSSLAWLLRADGSFNEAEGLLLKACAIDPFLPEYRIRLATVLADKRLRRESEAVFLEAIALAPEANEAYVRAISAVGIRFRDRLFLDRVKGLYAAGQVSDPEFSRYLELLALVALAGKSVGDDPAAILAAMDEGSLSWQQSYLIELFTVAEKAGNTDFATSMAHLAPEHPLLLGNGFICNAIGNAFMARQDHDRAALWYGKAEAAAPAESAAVANLMNCQLARGDGVAGIRAAAAWLERNAREPGLEFWKALAGLHQAAGDREARRDCLERALRLRPSDIFISNDYQECLRELGDGEGADRAATELNGQNIADRLGQALSIMVDADDLFTDQGESRREEAARGRPHDIEAAKEYLRCLANRGKHRETARFGTTWEANHGDVADPNFHFFLSWAYRELGDADRELLYARKESDCSLKAGVIPNAPRLFALLRAQGGDAEALDRVKRYLAILERHWSGPKEGGDWPAEDAERHKMNMHRITFMGLGKGLIDTDCLDCAEILFEGILHASPEQGDRIEALSQLVLIDLKRARGAQAEARVAAERPETWDREYLAWLKGSIADSYREAGFAEDAIRLYTETLALKYPEFWMELYHLSSLLLEKGASEEALRIVEPYAAAAADQPGTHNCDHSLWNMLGWHHLMLSHFADAEAAFRRSLALDGKYSNQWGSSLRYDDGVTGLVQTFAKQGKGVELARFVSEACRGEYEHAYKVREFGEYLVCQGFLEQGLDCFRRAVEIDHTQATGVCLFLKKEGRERIAAELFETWLAETWLETAGDGVLHNLLGVYHYQQAKEKGGDPDSQAHAEKAERHFKRALEEQPGNGNYAHWLMRGFSALGNREEAISSAEDWIATEGNRPGDAFWNELGVMHFRQGKYARAEACFRAAREIEGDNRNYLQNLLSALSEQRKFSELIDAAEAWLSVAGRDLDVETRRKLTMAYDMCRRRNNHIPTAK